MHKTLKFDSNYLAHEHDQKLVTSVHPESISDVKYSEWLHFHLDASSKCQRLEQVLKALSSQQASKPILFQWLSTSFCFNKFQPTFCMLSIVYMLGENQLMLELVK